MSAVLVVAVGVAGCAGEPRGAVVAKVNRSAIPVDRAAPYDAQYVLHARQPVTWPATAPSTLLARARPHKKYAQELTAQWLRRGEHLGFKKESAGQLVAFVGKDQLELPAGRYRWQVRPGTDPQARRGEALREGTEKTVYAVLAVIAVGVSLLLWLHQSGEQE